MQKLSVLLCTTLLVSACSSAPGPQGDEGKPGASSLVRLDEEAEGAHCATGGTAIRSGVDKDFDGVLSDAEVTATRYVCNGSGKQGDKGDRGDKGDDGTAGSKALVRLEVEKPGDHCEFGGTAVFAGVDTNGDGELSDEEAGEPEYVCDGFGAGESAVWDGDFTINTPADALALRGVRHVKGHLHINDTGARSLTLARLERVDGSIVLGGNPVIESVAMPSLRTVGGAVQVGSNPALVSFTLPLLETVADELVFADNAALASLDLPALTTVTGFVGVFSNPALALIDLSALATVKDDFVMFENTALASLDLSRLKTLEGKEFVIAGNPALPSLDLSALTTATGTLVFVENAALASIDLSALVSLEGAFSVAENAVLATLSTDAVRSIGASAGIAANPRLEALSFQSLVTVKNDFLVFDNDSLLSVSLDALETVGVEPAPAAPPEDESTPGKFGVVDNLVLESLFAPNLVVVLTHFAVAENPALPSAQATTILEALDPAPTDGGVVCGNKGDAACPT